MSRERTTSGPLIGCVCRPLPAAIGRGPRGSAGDEGGCACHLASPQKLRETSTGGGIVHVAGWEKIGPRQTFQVGLVGGRCKTGKYVLDGHVM